MDIAMGIRSVIFLVAGLPMILVPEKVYKFQIYLIEKLHIRYNVERDRKHYTLFAIIFFIISIILFVYSITH